MSSKSLPNAFTKAVARLMREQPAIKQDELTRLLGKSQGTISNYLNGISLPSEADAKKMGERFGEDLTPAWRKAHEERKTKDSKNREQGWIKRKRHEQPLDADEVFKKLNALPPEEQERIKKLIDEAYRRHYESPAGGSTKAPSLVRKSSKILSGKKTSKKRGVS